jgi:hypothetical protein
MFKSAVLVFALVICAMVSASDDEEKQARAELKLAMQDSARAGDRLRKAIDNKPPFKYILTDGTTIEADAVYEKQDNRQVKLLIGKNGKVIREVKEDQIKEVQQPDRSEVEAAAKAFETAKQNMDRALEAVRRVVERKKQEKEQAKPEPQPQPLKKGAFNGRKTIILDGETVVLIKRGEDPPIGIRYCFEEETC